MAKTIKAIVCPKCGSNKKTELKSDYYICDSCKTEYYLDNDDITIIHKNDTPQQVQPTVKPLKIAVIVGILFSIFTIFFLFNIFSVGSSSNTTVSTAMEVDLDDDQMLLCENNKGELIYVTVGIERTGDYQNRDEKMVAYFDDYKGKNIKKQELNFSIPKNKASSPFREKYFSNGETYLVFNEKTLFVVDPNALEVREVGKEFFNAPEFANGLAKLEPDYTDDFYKIQTLDGKSYIYYPIIKTVFDSDMHHSYDDVVPSGAINTTQFSFVGDTWGAKSLVKFVQKKQSGYPSQDLYFDIVDNEPSVRNHPDNFVSFENFFPNRKFFNPIILGYNKELLLFSFTLDANSQSAQQIQALDVKTRAIRWTFDCGPLDKHVNYYPYKTLSNKEFTIMQANFGAITFDNKTGEVFASFDKR